MFLGVVARAGNNGIHVGMSAPPKTADDDNKGGPVPLENTTDDLSVKKKTEAKTTKQTTESALFLHRVISKRDSADAFERLTTKKAKTKQQQKTTREGQAPHPASAIISVNLLTRNDESWGHSSHRKKEQKGNGHKHSVLRLDNAVRGSVASEKSRVT